MTSLKEDKRFKVVYENETQFKIIWDKTEVLWAQYSKMLNGYRVIMLSDKRIHHLSSEQSVIDLAADEIHVDMIVEGA